MFSFTQCLLHAQGNVTKCNENHISLQIKGQRDRVFHTKVKQKNLFNVTLGITGTGVKQTSRRNFEGLIQEKHVC